MIYYETNMNWMQDLVHFGTSWTIRKVARAVLISGLYSAIVAVLTIEALDEPFTLNTSIFSLLGVVLSILLVFRTNTAYDRWWEGRKQWGALVNNCRSLALMLHNIMPEEDRESRKYFAKNIGNFCLALKEHLRKGVKLSELQDLTVAEKEEYETKAHVPNYIVYKIYHRLQMIYKAGHISDPDMMTVKPVVQSLTDIQGACERIRKTPIPFSYAVYLKSFISTYLLILPFGLLGDFRYYTIPLVMLVTFAMIGVELIAEEIEDPFGLDCNDLPTGELAVNIRKNVYEIFDMRIPGNPEDKERAMYQKVF